MNAPEFQRLKGTWESLGRDDPLWAVVSHDDKVAGGWELGPFLQTGEADVKRFHELLMECASAPPRFREVLDFGCGVGRLSLAWSRRAARVVGVDISSTMIEQGCRLAKDAPNVELVLNARPDLASFESGRFDLVASHVCLQHMPWPLAAGYIGEFARVCAPGGLVAFQLPSRLLQARWLPQIRRGIINCLPPAMARAYRRWRHGHESVFEMHFTPPPTVLETASRARLSLLRLEPDQAAGEGTEGFIYVFRNARG